MPHNLRKWITSFCSSRENSEDRLLDHLVWSPDEYFVKFRSLMKSLESILNRLRIWMNTEENRIDSQSIKKSEKQQESREQPNRFPIDQDIGEIAQVRGELNRFSIDSEIRATPVSL